MVRQQEVQGPDPARGLTGTIWDSSLQNRDNKTTLFPFPGYLCIVRMTCSLAYSGRFSECGENTAGVLIINLQYRCNTYCPYR